jgi:hypothetical protein
MPVCLHLALVQFFLQSSVGESSVQQKLWAQLCASESDHQVKDQEHSKASRVGKYGIGGVAQFSEVFGWDQWPKL